MTDEASARLSYDSHPLQRAAKVSKDDRHASLDALHTLEGALSEPSPGREDRWLDQVLAALDDLVTTLDAQAAGDAETASLLSEIAEDEPRLRPRIERLRREHDDLRDGLQSLRTQIAPQAGLVIDAADIRERLAALARRLRQHQAREADLIYEAVNINIGSGD